MSKTDNLMNFLKIVIPAFHFVVPASERESPFAAKLNKFKLLQLQALAPLV